MCADRVMVRANSQCVILCEGSLQLTMHEQSAYTQVKKWLRDDPYYQRAADEPERAESLCRIAESTFPTSRNRRTPNSNAPAASAGPARARRSNSPPSAFRRVYSPISGVAPPGGRCPIKPSFTKCRKRRQRRNLNRRTARSPAMAGISFRIRRVSPCASHGYRRASPCATRVTGTHSLIKQWNLWLQFTCSKPFKMRQPFFEFGGVQERLSIKCAKQVLRRRSCDCCILDRQRQCSCSCYFLLGERPHAPLHACRC